MCFCTLGEEEKELGREYFGGMFEQSAAFVWSRWRPSMGELHRERPSDWTAYVALTFQIDGSVDIRTRSFDRDVRGHDRWTIGRQFKRRKLRGNKHLVKER